MLSPWGNRALSACVQKARLVWDHLWDSSRLLRVASTHHQFEKLFHFINVVQPQPEQFSKIFPLTMKFHDVKYAM